MEWQKRNGVRKTIEGLMTGLFCGISIISVILAGGMVFWVLKSGLPAWNTEFLFSKGSVLKGKTGLLEYLWNTVRLLLVTLPLSGGIGVMTAVYLCEYVKKEKIKQIICIAIEILSGIPSIVFGLFGMVLFGEIMNLGYSILSGAFTLTIMILPIMITNSQEALQMVPKEYRLGALALGAGKWQMVRMMLLPGARSGILAGFTLATGKILGEAAVLLFTAGSRGSLAVAVYMYAGKGRITEACGAALLLLSFVFLLHLLQQSIKEKQKT